MNMQDANLYAKDAGFARVSAGCDGEGGGFRSFLHKQGDGTWVILGTSQMSTIGCSEFDGTGIPASVAATCIDAAAVERPSSERGVRTERWPPCPVLQAGRHRSAGRATVGGIPCAHPLR